MPYKPYIQKAIIFGPDKRSFRELNALEREGKLNDTVMRMYRPKATEEFYDLESDPYELNNLAEKSDCAEIKAQLRTQLDRWMQQQGDEGIDTELKALQRQGPNRKWTPYEPKGSGATD